MPDYSLNYPLDLGSSPEQNSTSYTSTVPLPCKDLFYLGATAFTLFFQPQALFFPRFGVFSFGTMKSGENVLQDYEICRLTVDREVTTLKGSTPHKNNIFLN